MQSAPNTAFTGADAPSKRPTPIPLVIVGADAYLAARPATPVQVDHACRAAGFAAVIPATWGDELIANACARKLATRAVPSGIFCSCQRVRDRLLGPGPDLVPFMVSLVAPPIATARYLQRLYGDTPLDITYVGNCPSANSDPSIARQIRPEDFFASLTARGIVAAREPLVFNSFFAPDRRRSVSLPGGLPIDRILQEPPGASDEESPEKNGASSLPLVPRSVVSIRDVEYATELAQYLIMAEPVLLDVAPRLGCACSGAVSGVPVADARAAVMALEPPRSPGPVVDTSIDLDLDFKPHVDVTSGPPPAGVTSDPPPARLGGPPIPQLDIEDFWLAEPATPVTMADAPVRRDEPKPVQAPAPKSAQAPATKSPVAEDPASASWLASSVLAGSDQLLAAVTSPSSSRSTSAPDRGAGVSQRS